LRCRGRLQTREPVTDDTAARAGDKRTPNAAEALKAKPTPADRSEIRVQRLRPRDVERRPDLADRFRPPALEPTAAGAAPRARLSRRLRLELRPPLETATNEPRRARQRDRRYRRLLALADVSATAAALAICIPLLGEGDMVTPLVAAGAPLIVLIGKVVGLYDRDELLLRKNTLDEAPKLFQVATLMALLLVLGHTFLIDGDLGRKQVLGFWLTLAVALPVARTGARALAKRLVPVEQCLLVGDPDACDLARAKIEASTAVHARVVAQLDLESAAEADDAVAALALLTSEHGIDRVVIAPPGSDHGELLNLIRAAKSLSLRVSVLPRMLEVVGSAVEFDDVDGLGVLGVRRFGLTRSSWLVKRGTDLVGSGLLLLLLAPLLAAIAAAIRIDSRGPALFRQLRVGRDGRIFEMLKFRTMVEGADRQKAELAPLNEADGLFKIADDPRVTRVGRLLRRTSLDELPQLVNVLRGEMSLVGPRPLVLEDDRHVEGWYRRRLHLTPGMTGRWQVLGSARIPLHEMVKLDYLYVATWSWWGDIKILLQTIGFVVARRGL
jgi:exopolysaccharide biosynthesis polyprenyl glycosylphosphotransferase